MKDERECEFKNLYIAVNEMMAELGAKGSINTKTNEMEVTAVMDALYQLDGGVYDTSKVFGESQ